LTTECETHISENAHPFAVLYSYCIINLASLCAHLRCMTLCTKRRHLGWRTCNPKQRYILAVHNSYTVPFKGTWQYIPGW